MAISGVLNVNRGERWMRQCQMSAAVLPRPSPDGSRRLEHANQAKDVALKHLGLARPESNRRMVEQIRDRFAVVGTANGLCNRGADVNNTQLGATLHLVAKRHRVGDHES